MHRSESIDGHAAAVMIGGGQASHGFAGQVSPRSGPPAFDRLPQASGTNTRGAGER